jgi:hypothetical protein
MARDDFQMPEFDPTINPMALDTEWLAQPNLYYEWATRAADARRRLDEAKADLDLTRANLKKLVTNNPDQFGLVKTTEAAVDNAIIEELDYQTSLKALNKAKHLCDVYGAVLTTLDHRKRALEHLVELHGMNYFSAPRVSGDAGEGMRKAEKKSARRVRASVDDLPE